MVDAEVEFLGPGSRGSVLGDALWNPRGTGGYPKGISGAKADVKEVPWMHQRRHLIWSSGTFYGNSGELEGPRGSREHTRGPRG